MPGSILSYTWFVVAIIVLFFSRRAVDSHHRSRPSLTRGRVRETINKCSLMDLVCVPFLHSLFFIYARLFSMEIPLISAGFPAGIGCQCNAG